jgi:geranylgeranyl pyrophosphate synthase|tara:strand:- start:9959 stop:10915 length:957 start_codon:yes stop_codon:yes gene_type:complete
MDKLNDFKNIFLEEFSKIQKFEGPSYLYDPIKYFIKSPGKRLRPVIVLFLGDLFKNDKKDSINGALGVELLHNFTLVHDDIMDEDDLRHNVVTIHKKWDNAHAVLSGDGLGALGPIFIGKIKKNTLKILIRYNEVILEICEGQAYDMEFEKKDFVSVNDYLLMSAKKTGSLFELCFEIASLISDKYEKYLKNLKDLGRNLGIIFQIQDDILELTANNDVLGKSTFSDIKRNKKTILTCLAMEKNLNDWNKLIETINKKNNIEKKELMNDFFDIKNLREESNNLLTEYINKCNEIISQLPEEIQGGLNELIGYIIKRDK